MVQSAADRMQTPMMKPIALKTWMSAAGTFAAGACGTLRALGSFGPCIGALAACSVGPASEGRVATSRATDNFMDLPTRSDCIGMILVYGGWGLLECSGTHGILGEAIWNSGMLKRRRAQLEMRSSKLK